jgi:hypothetical protein
MILREKKSGAKHFPLEKGLTPENEIALKTGFDPLS